MLGKYLHHSVQFTQTVYKRIGRRILARSFQWALVETRVIPKAQAGGYSGG